MNMAMMERLYERLLGEIDVGIHAIDRQGKTIIYNRKMMEMESMEGKEVLNKDIREVFSFHDNQHSTLLEALETGKTTRDMRQTYFNNKGKEITTVNNTFPIDDGAEIIAAVEIARDITQLEHVIKENVLKRKNRHFTFGQIIGREPELLAVIDEAKLATRTASSVLIAGETGTGKELFAQSIHNGSTRSAGPFVAQNCAAIPESLMESLLFGTSKGAFTGALDSPGLFEQADGGTLLLDEINSLDPLLQGKLLRVLQEKTVRRVGGTTDKKVDVRIIATVNEDPIEAVAENRLRKDLYYRLSVVSLFIPPLRERKEDVPLLANEFLNKYNAMFRMNIRRISDEAMDILEAHDWPGNVRELEHLIEGVMNLLMEENTIQAHHLPARLRRTDRTVSNQDTSAYTLRERLTQTERQYIQQTLLRCDSNITHAAKILGMSRQSLQYRMKKLGMGK